MAPARGFTAGREWLPSLCLQGERDGHTDEVEGLALLAGGLGEHRGPGAGGGKRVWAAFQGLFGGMPARLPPN